MTLPTRSAITSASATLTRAGMTGELRAGAAAKSARVRMKGQKNSPSQRATSASESLSMRSLDDALHRHRGMLDRRDHALAGPTRGEPHHEHHREEPRYEAQGQIGHA